MRYTQQQKEDALSLAEQIGAQKASEKLNVSYQSLLIWRKKKANAAKHGASAEDAVPAETPAEEKIKTPSKAAQSLELQMQVLRHEIAQLKKQLGRQADAIRALSRIDE